MQTSMIKHSCGEGFIEWTIQVEGTAGSPPIQCSGREPLLPEETNDQAIYRILTREHDRYSPLPKETEDDEFSAAFKKATEGES